MTKRDLHDRIIDQLLREMLGGDRPRDMTARVLHQAKIMDRFRRRAWWGGGSAIAAAVAVVIGLYFFWPREHEYPNPLIDEGITVADDMAAQRGATFYTQEKEGHMALGGYVTVAMAPESQLNLAGSKFQEKVLLNRGALDVDVTKHKGQFDIAVGQATVHVTGTKFNVRVGEESTPTEWRKVLKLAVKEGSVEVQNLPDTANQTVTSDGGEKTFVLARTSRSLSAGLLAAAQQSARVGARGGMVNTVTPRVANAINAQQSPTLVPAPNRGQTPASLPPAVPPTGDQSVVLRTTLPAAGYSIGRVQHAGPLYYLISQKDGNYFMFERSTVAAAHPEWLTISGDQYMRVTWREGVVVGMEKYPPAGTARGEHDTTLIQIPNDSRAAMTHFALRDGRKGVRGNLGKL